ncbi:AraC family transcriptional regulator [Candidatus Soleaferrea massiliensis]|uniref:AraC family transcriptional regulator n=1 Tax=Candidatus Soleaferrea massiliensis TaxID=1470354 RepID=UPI000AC8BF72|nr:AraC family transcriptional regulator [Candidatus Soleaferrea massiliensis]
MMHAWEQIQITLDYIEEHLGQELRIEHLAGMAGLSPFYYQRLFSRLVRKPVAQYIKLRRMAKAADILGQTQERILDAALELGFSSHEQFTRIFKDTFGMTPQAYRQSPRPLNRMTKPQLLLNYTVVDEDVPLITDGIVLEITRKKLAKPEFYIGIEQKVPNSFVEGLGVESGIDPLDTVWRTFHSRKEEIPNLIPHGDELGAAYPGSEEGYFCYFAGAAARSASAVQPFKSWELPAGEYLVCTFEAEDFETLVMDALYKAHRYLFDTWLPGHGLRTCPFSAERYQSHDHDTTGMEIWLKLLSS